jgi:hypothetical protein
MRPKFQKRSALKFVGRIIPCAKRIGISREAEDNATSLSWSRGIPSSGIEELMVNRRVNKEEKSGRISFPIRKISIALVFVVLISVLLYLFYPQFFRSLAFKTSRVKNTFSYYVLQGRPHFYYLEV